ncbi:hypothetical protein BO71DRAFT_355357, partial [Aspergillus ellipticus CBS 707.79]
MSSTLDDIFGSSPPHPSTTTTTTTTTTPAPPAEPSDLPSLRRQHVTAGYRDGISASKSTHVQTGFDAGFPVGAQLGLRAGTILGILEGVLRGYESNSRGGVIKKPGQVRKSTTSNGSSTTAAAAAAAENGSGNGDEAQREARRAEILKLYQRAITELDVRTVFGGVSEGDLVKEKAEVRLARQGEGVLGEWEGKMVAVSEWEGVMEALEMKEGV